MLMCNIKLIEKKQQIKKEEKMYKERELHIHYVIWNTILTPRYITLVEKHNYKYNTQNDIHIHHKTKYI